MAVTRLTLTFAAASASHELATAGAALAARLGVHVEALLFVERNLLRLAELQLLRRIRTPTGESEAVSAVELALELRLQGERLRAAVGAAAQKAGIAWTFESVEEESQEFDQPVAGEIAVVSTDGLLSHRRDLVRRLFRRVHGLLLLPVMGAAIQRPGVLLPDTPAPGFLHDAVEVVQRLGRGRAVDVVGSEESSEAAARWFDDRDLAPTIHRLPPRQDVGALAERLPASLDSLITAAPEFPERGSPLDRLLDTLHRPVLLLRDRSA